MFDDYLSKLDEQAIEEQATFAYHNGVVNQSIDMVFLLKHYEYVASLGITPHPQVLKDFLLTNALIKDGTLPEIDTINNFKKQQHYQLIYWMVVVNAQAYREKIKPYLESEDPTLEQAQQALLALQEALLAYIAQYGDDYTSSDASTPSWPAIDYKLRKIAEEYHYHDVSYDLAGIKFRFNPRMEQAAQFLLASAVLGMILMLQFGIMVDYGIWSKLFYITLTAAASFPYLSISHMHRSIRDKAASEHDKFQGILAVDNHHKVAVISFFAAFTILAFNMVALIAADAFAITMVTFTLLALAAATTHEYISTQKRNNQTRTLSNEKWIANRVDTISEDKIKLDDSGRYFNHTRAMFLSAGNDMSKNSLIYRRSMYESAYNARFNSSSQPADTFHDDLMKDDTFYQANAFVNESIDFVAAVMALTTDEAYKQWVCTVVEQYNAVGQPENKTVHELCSMSAYIQWMNQTVALYLNNKDGKLQPLTDEQKTLLAKPDPDAEDCKALDKIRAQYPQYHLLKACASLDLSYNANDIASYRIELQKRILHALGPQLEIYTQKSLNSQTLESLHQGLRQAQNQYGYWSLAAIPAQCKTLDYQSTQVLVALGLTMATAVVASLVYGDAVGLTFNVGWMGFALTCAAMTAIASVAWDGELQKKMDVKQYHKDMEQTFKAAPLRATALL